MIFRLFFPFIFFIFIATRLLALGETTFPEVIVNAIKTGNAKELARYFNQNIEMVILSEENVYSKTQAELIIKDFFSKHTPSEFIILHQGGKEGAQYAIGTVKTTTGNFRIYFLLKIKNEQPFIHQLRVEKE